MKTLSAAHPHRPVILMTETLNFGALPITLGAPGLRPKGYITIGLNPILLTSIDHPPFGTGMLPDSSPEGRERNKIANAAQKEVFSEAQGEFAKAIMSVGAREPDIFLLDSLYAVSDRFIQMCAPSVEYPRSDAPKTLRFAGGYPAAKIDIHYTKPAWWHEITDNTSKKIVFVCQGTVAMDFNQLVIPTIDVLKDRSDILLVVSLGRPNITLSAEVNIPPNCRVADYIPYDDLLPYCDVFITTGGYGSFQRALLNGTPLVVAGTTEEKPETAARAEWAGIAVNLRTSYPSSEQLSQAIDEILSNSEYKSKALKIQAEVSAYDPVSVIIENIEELAGINALTEN